MITANFPGFYQDHHKFPFISSFSSTRYHLFYLELVQEALLLCRHLLHHSGVDLDVDDQPEQPQDADAAQEDVEVLSGSEIDNEFVDLLRSPLTAVKLNRASFTTRMSVA